MLTVTEKAFFLKLTRAGGWKFPGTVAHQEQLFEDALNFIRDRHIVAAVPGPPGPQLPVRGTLLATFTMIRARSAAQAAFATQLQAADGQWSVTIAGALLGFARRVAGGATQVHHLAVPVTRPANAIGFAIAAGNGADNYNVNGGVMPWFGTLENTSSGISAMQVPLSATERLTVRAYSGVNPQYLALNGAGTALSAAAALFPHIDVYLAVN